MTRELQAVEITDGRTYLGAIVERGPRKWRAVDATGHRLGDFATRELARLAVLDASRFNGEDPR